MAKKDKSTKKDKKSDNGKDAKELEHKAKADAKAEKAARKQGKADESKQGKDRADAGSRPGEPAPQAAEPAVAQHGGRPDESTGTAALTDGHPPVDQVAVLKLALRDTEAKLVAAEHRLRQVQQQLDDERRALAEAFTPSAEEQEAVVDAAVVETVAEAVVAAELATVVGGSSDAVNAAEVAAATLEEAAGAIDAALAGSGEPVPTVQGTQRGSLTPPLPEHGTDDGPSESWTLVHLRKEADRRGITGVSNLTKAALVERLRA